MRGERWVDAVGKRERMAEALGGRAVAPVDRAPNRYRHQYQAGRRSSIDVMESNLDCIRSGDECAGPPSTRSAVDGRD